MIYEKDHIIVRSNRKHPLDLITNRNMQILTIDTGVLSKIVNRVLLANQRRQSKKTFWIIWELRFISWKKFLIFKRWIYIIWIFDRVRYLI